MCDGESIEGGGRTEEKKRIKEKKEKFPLCVKALVIGQFGAAAQKDGQTKESWLDGNVSGSDSGFLRWLE